MHSIIQRSLMAALLAGLLLSGASRAQSPSQKEEFSKEIVQPTRLSVDDIVERLMAFDKDKKGKVTKDDLPERMQFLIELGDTNKDGALDKDEIVKLATKLAANPGMFGGGPVRVGFGPGPGPRGGFGVAGTFRVGPENFEGIIEDMKLQREKKEKALTAVKSHQESLRKFMEQARAELLENMKGIMTEEEFKDFQAALNRPRGESFFGFAPDDARQGGGIKKLDPLQK